ncbi:MAG: leucine--tRNA ligase [Nanobdellota archaeon]
MDFKKIERKWQKKWEDDKVFRTTKDDREKFYCLEMFPYPSGSGLHMGHSFNYTIGDIQARARRMMGFNVLYPMGYDSFGLPAENAAIKNDTHPRDYTRKSINNFISQQKSLGLSYDWERMVSTCEPEYYKWNQFIFQELLKKGLVYRKKSPVNWCPKCSTVLANEQVHDGRCWRHEDTEVEPRELEQWFIKTTEYAQELLDKLPELEWPERVKAMQRNWIGRSEGVTFNFEVVDEDDNVLGNVDTFTTRPDTVYGLTYLVLAVEHPKVIEWAKDKDKASEFVKETKKLSTMERTSEEKEKKGMPLGVYFRNSFTGEKLPVWVADYVLPEYGTGAVMAVPAHDQRDFDFASKYDLPVKQVISEDRKEHRLDQAYTEEGVMINSGEFNGMKSSEAINKIADFAEKKGRGKREVNYKLKDWLVSRQRYWGTPIPIIHCDKCGAVPAEIPVRLPDDVKFGQGNPLETSDDFVNVKCPECGGDAKRETDTMDTFFDSSWYFLRYTDNKNEEKPFDKEKADYFMPVDQYIGGAEHACMHLIYARFFTKALRDMGYVDYDEPFRKLFNQGMLHGPDGHVMSKSRGNVVLPETVSENYGIDTARFFLTSLASPDKDMQWSEKGIEGSLRFIKKVISYIDTVKFGESSDKVESKVNKAIKSVTEDIKAFRYNIATISIRELFDSFEEEINKEELEKFLKLLHPFCPHLTEELWEKIGNEPYLSLAEWPESDESKIDEEAEMIEEAAHNVRRDILRVKQLAGIEKPSMIRVIVSPEWKFSFFSKLKEEIRESRNPGQVMKNIMADEGLKKHGKEISKMVPKLVKDDSKLPKMLLGQEKEIEGYKEYKDFLEGEFDCDVEVVKAEDSDDPKAKQASPLKPAIVLE